MIYIKNNYFNCLLRIIIIIIIIIIISYLKWYNCKLFVVRIITWGFVY